MIELHHGRISVESELGKGTVFIVCFPLGKKHFKKEEISKQDFTRNSHRYDSSHRESLRYEMDALDSSVNVDSREIDEHKEKPSNELTVLLVEDNNSLRRQIKDELKSYYKIIEARNGKEGFDLTGKLFPDLIVSDIMMPEMDGIELCRNIKSNFDTCHIPIILLTARGLVEHRIQGYQTGADAYISKPFDLDELAVMISNILKSRKMLKDRFSNSPKLVSLAEFTTNNRDEAFLEGITNHTLENIDNPEFGYDDLIKKSGHSRSAFYRKLSALTDMTPSHFVNSIRVKKAAEILLKEDISIKEIGYKVGFNSPSYFNKTFLKVMNKTPLEYISENKVLS